MNLGADLLLVLPEWFLLGMVCVVLLVDTLYGDRAPELSYRLSQLALFLTMLLTLMLYPGETRYAFHGALVVDGMSKLIKFVVCVTAIFAFTYSREYLVDHGLNQREHYVLGLLAVLGSLILISAHSFLTVFLGLELLSLSLYAMVAVHRGSKTGPEAAIKYFVLGALASGMLLYGISILYGTTGELRLDRTAAAIASGDGKWYALQVLSLAFILVGIAFKLGAAPFHTWVPDVYQGAPTPVALFVGSVPKLAGFAMATRLLFDGLPSLEGDWSQMLILLAVLSMLLGNLVAIAQRNVKRMLAYSTIAHMGFLILGFLSGTAEGFAGAMFYVVVYAVMSLGAFGLIALLSRNGEEIEHIDDFSGLFQRSPWIAFLMLAIMFSMAGVPPFAGFWAKWFVIQQTINAGYVWLAVLAVICSIIGAYYYLRIIKIIYFDKSELTTQPKLPPLTLGAISANGMLLILIGLLPGSLMRLCLEALAR